MEDDVIIHWGIKGMKWGVRRYQNKDGSLTAAGKKKLAKETEAVKKEASTLKNRKAVQDKLDKLEAQKKANEELKKQLDGRSKKSSSTEKSQDSSETKNSSIQKKSYKDMTDEELRNTVTRLQNEKLALDYERQINSMNASSQPSKKDSFASKFIRDAAVPALISSGKNLIGKWLDKKGASLLGLDAKDSFDDVAKEAKYWLNKNLADKNKKEYEARNSKKKSDEKTSEKDKNKNNENSQNNQKSQNKYDKYEDTVFEGTVEGYGTSRRNSSRTNSGKNWTNDSIIDADYWEVVSDSTALSTGRQYMSDIYELPSSTLLLPEARNGRK